MSAPIIIVGAGGHARVLIDALRALRRDVVGLVDVDPASHSKAVLDIPVLGGDEVVLQYPRSAVELVNGVGSTGSTLRRRRLFESFKDHGFDFAIVAHPNAQIAWKVELCEGAQVFAGAVVQVGSIVGRNAIINSNATVDHNCHVGAHVHVAPGATLCGDVRVGDGAHVGAAACVLQGVELGAECVVGAGAVVLKDVPPGHRVAGVPARELHT